MASGRPSALPIVGGRDLTTTAQYLGGDITTHFAHNGPTGAFIHVGHTELLRQSASGITESARAVVDRIPFRRSGRLLLPGRGGSRLRRPRVERAHRLHPGPLSAPSTRAGRAVVPVPSRRDQRGPLALDPQTLCERGGRSRVPHLVRRGVRAPWRDHARTVSPTTSIWLSAEVPDRRGPSS